MENKKPKTADGLIEYLDSDIKYIKNIRNIFVNADLNSLKTQFEIYSLFCDFIEMKKETKRKILETKRFYFGK